ncbi:hypothetical protein AB0M28_13675 [Streptomyces sp. NPDC051940]|uniref:zinc finger domain-containing protein n=1 Tax=Streptomyces sp. NPDC051940 TaxID=3155675 RepID=UPI003445876E
MSANDRAVDMPAIRVDCPVCLASAGLVCTSLSSDKPMLSAVHPARTAAWHEQQKRGGR